MNGRISWSDLRRCSVEHPLVYWESFFEINNCQFLSIYLRLGLGFCLRSFCVLPAMVELGVRCSKFSSRALLVSWIVSVPSCCPSACGRVSGQLSSLVFGIRDVSPFFRSHHTLRKDGLSKSGSSWLLSKKQFMFRLPCSEVQISMFIDHLTVRFPFLWPSLYVEFGFERS